MEIQCRSHPIVWEMSKSVQTNNSNLIFNFFLEYVSEGDCSSATPDSSIHTEGLGSRQPGSPSSANPVSVPETPLASAQSSPANYTLDFASASPSSSRQVRINVVIFPVCVSVFSSSLLMAAEFILSVYMNPTCRRE